MNRNLRKWFFRAALAGSLSLGSGGIFVRAQNPQPARAQPRIQQKQNDGQLELVARRASRGHRRGRRHRRHHRRTT
jgi:hypothetical protein